MKLTKLRAVLFLGIGVTFLPVLEINGSVSAQASGNRTSNTNSSSTLKISPVRTELSVKPGETRKVTTYITNLSKQPIVLKPIENDFVAGDERGTPSIILDENSYAPTHSLKRFMVPLSNVTVEPGATKQVDLTIKVPANAQAGGYFGALRFAPANEAGGSSVNLTGSVTSLILMTVPGKLVELLDLTNFDVQQKGSTGTNFRSPDGLELALRFQNQGNVHLAPFGQVNVLKGDKVVYTHNFNAEESKDNVLPDSSRKWNVPLKNVGKFGKYTVKGNFTYGTTSQSIEVEKSFWVVPTMYIIIGVGALLGLVALIVGVTVFLKSYKRRILRNAGRR